MIMERARNCRSSILRRPSGSIITGCTKSRRRRVIKRGLQQPFDQPAARDEWPALDPDLGGSRASLDEDAPQAELRFDDGRSHRCRSAIGPRERSSFDAPAARSPPFEDHAADEQFFERGWDEDSSQVLPEASRVRAPRWRGGTQRRDGTSRPWRSPPLSYWWRALASACSPAPRNSIVCSPPSAGGRSRMEAWRRRYGTLHNRTARRRQRPLTDRR